MINVNLLIIQGKKNYLNLQKIKYKKKNYFF